MSSDLFSNLLATPCFTKNAGVPAYFIVTEDCASSELKCEEMDPSGRKGEVSESSNLHIPRRLV